MQVISIIPTRVVFSGGRFDSDNAYIHKVTTGGDFAFPAGRTMYRWSNDTYDAGYNSIGYEFNGFFKGTYPQHEYNPSGAYTSIIMLSS